VRSDESTSAVRISVVEGRVSVTSYAHAAHTFTLAAGDVGEVTDSTTHVTTIDDIVPKTEWIHGQLVFRDIPVSTVLEALGRWYGYEFHCTDADLPHRTVTIGISPRSSAEALAAIEQILGVSLTVAGDTVTLTPRPARPTSGTSRVQTYDIWTPTREAGR
jgi:ferric-dicitrate binding protein FerR (iron transport regulator)